MSNKLKITFYVLIALISGGIFFVLLFLTLETTPTPRSVAYGVTFSRAYARDDLGLNADAVLSGALGDLGIRRFRIPAYWSELERERGRWTFDSLDRDLAAIQMRNGTVTLAIGEKLPRWPECWVPAWWKTLDRTTQQAETLRYLETVVKRYQDNPTITSWQVENEPFFSFGDCPLPDPTFYGQEIALVKKLDPTRQITTTDSGELSTWLSQPSAVDMLGVSVYRVVSHRVLGILRFWFITPPMYARKALFVTPFGPKSVYVSEFQMEPWSTQPLADTPLSEQFKTMSLAQLRQNLDDAARLKLSPVDFWGVEWWYWMKTVKGHPEFWNAAHDFFVAHIQ